MNSITIGNPSQRVINSSWQQGYEVGVESEAAQRTQLAIRWATVGFFTAIGMAFVIAILAGTLA